MSENGGSDSAGLQRLEQKMDALAAAESRAKNTSRVAVIAIAITAVVMVASMLKPFDDARKNTEPYVTALQQGAQQRLQPLAISEMNALKRDLKPIIDAAAIKAREEHLPGLMALAESEGQAFIANVTVDFEQQVGSYLEDFQNAQMAKLTAAVPELGDPDTAADVVENFATMTQSVSERIVDDLLTAHYDALVQLEEDFNSIEVPAEVAAMSPAELDEHITALLLELITLRLSDTGAAPASDESSDLLVGVETNTDTEEE